MKKIMIVMVMMVLAGCATDADIASRNLSKSADMFEVNRRVVFYNGITGEYILSVEGRCSVKADMADNQVEITCKVGPDSYKKHYLGLSDNVTYFVEQLETSSVNVYRYRVIFKPESIVPTVSLSLSR